MKAIDFRNRTFDELKDRLLDSEWRSKVYWLLRANGSMTTREAARLLNREVHAIRPRFTELKDHGFVDLVPDQEVTPDGALYFARTPEQFEAWRAAQPQLETSGQLQMKV